MKSKLLIRKHAIFLSARYQQMDKNTIWRDLRVETGSELTGGVWNNLQKWPNDQKCAILFNTSSLKTHQFFFCDIFDFYSKLSLPKTCLDPKSSWFKMLVSKVVTLLMTHVFTLKQKQHKWSMITAHWQSNFKQIDRLNMKNGAIHSSHHKSSRGDSQHF